MKIDEAAIDNAFYEATADSVVDLFDFTSRSETDDNWRLAILGEIRGYYILAASLKEKLKEDDE